MHSIPEQAREEGELILNALNVQQLDLGFDCDDDTVADTVEIFKQSVVTSCCRLNLNESKPKPKTSRLKALASKVEDNGSFAFLFKYIWPYVWNSQ